MALSFSKDRERRPIVCSAGARESGGQGGAIDPTVRPGGAALCFDQGREADGREIVGRPCLPALRELAVAGEPVIERRVGGGGRFVGFRLRSIAAGGVALGAEKPP